MSEIVPYISQGEMLPPEATLEELRDRANKEHHLVEETLGQALQHVIAAGAALTEVRDQWGGKPGWKKWIEENFDGGSLVASYYIRIYEYRELVQNMPNVSQAMRSLRGMPALRRTAESPTKYSDEIREEARALAGTGMTYVEIGRILDVDRRTIGRWIDPEVLQRHRERQREAGRKRREERLRKQIEARQRAAEREARRVGGALAESYSLIHKLEAPLDRAQREATDPEVRRLLTLAIHAQHTTLYRIVEALGAS